MEKLEGNFISVDTSIDEEKAVFNSGSQVRTQSRPGTSKSRNKTAAQVALTSEDHMNEYRSADQMMAIGVAHDPKSLSQQTFSP